jgi:hypothetical protein
MFVFPKPVLFFVFACGAVLLNALEKRCILGYTAVKSADCQWTTHHPKGRTLLNHHCKIHKSCIYFPFWDETVNPAFGEQSVVKLDALIHFEFCYIS